MYRLYREILLQYTDRIYASTLFRQIGSVIGPAFHLGGVYYVTPSLALMPYVRHWIQSLATRQTIARTPDLDQQIGLGLRKLIHNGWMIFIAGGRNNLRTVPQASGAIYYQLQSRWRGGLRVGFDDIADDTTALAVAGMKSGVTGILEYQFTPRDLFLGEVNFNYITGQDYSPLGTGSLIQIAYNHKFWLDFPDWNIGAFGRELIYTRSGRALTPLLRSFVPAGTSPSTALFIPPTQSEIGISFGFNQSLVSDYSFGSRYNRMDFDHVYTYRWRPFGEITALYDDIIGIGYGVLGGIKGSVFGRDQLYFFVNYSRNGTSFDADNITAGVHYEIYL